MLYLVGFFLLFIIILITITILVFKKSKPQSCEMNPSKKEEKEVSLDDLVKILKTEKTEVSKLEDALLQMTKRFPFPESEKEANQYFEFVYFFAKNPLSTAKLIVKMQKDLSQVNPKYQRQIEDFQMRGVEARSK